MSDLVVLGFDGIGSADDVLTKLRSLQKENLLDLDDACVVIRNQDGKVQLKQAVNLTAIGAAHGMRTGVLVGLLAGMLILNPLAGMALGGLAGTGMGALSGSLVDFGINDDFIKSLSETIPVNSSALFILVRKAQTEKVLAELSGVRGKVLRTSLSPDQEKKLQEALQGSSAPAKT